VYVVSGYALHSTAIVSYPDPQNNRYRKQKLSELKDQYNNNNNNNNNNNLSRAR